MVNKMSEWLNKFVEGKKAEDLPAVVEDLELGPDFDEEYEDQPTIADVNEILISLNNIMEENRYIVATLNALNEELKGGLALLRNKIDNISTHTQSQMDALEDKVTRSMVALEDGNEKRALLFAQALEEINDMVADPDQMTDVFKVAPDIAMEAIEREAQGELNDTKPFDPNDEIFLPESVEEVVKGVPLDEVYDGKTDFSMPGAVDGPLEATKIVIDGETVFNSEEPVEVDELGVGEIQTLAVPEGLEYSVSDYNVVMEYLNGDIKWKDMMKYAGGMKAAKALVDPVKSFHGIE